MVGEQQAVGRALVTVAAVVVLLGGCYLAAPFLGFVLLAVFFALLCHPLLRWLVGRGLAPGIALTLITVGLAAICLGLALLVGVSLGQVALNLTTYRDQIAQQLTALGDQLTARGVALPAQAAQTALIPELMGRVLGGVIGGVVSFLGSSFYVLLLMVFLLVEGPDMFARARQALGVENPVLTRLQSFSPILVRYFGIRTYLNALTGLGVALALFMLGVDFAGLWGVLLFFLSYVPYIGIFVATLPPTFLTLAEYGPGRALLVVLGITTINLVLENIIMPRLVGKGLSLSATVVFLSFFVWRGLLGAPGALLSVFLTVLVLLVLDSYEQTRWLARILTPEPRAAKVPAAGPVAGDAEVPGKP